MILAYMKDGSNLVTLAMNGWADPEPAWWLNLQARPVASVDVAGTSTRLRGERQRGKSDRGYGPGGAR